MSRAKPIALVAVLFAITAELLRANGPLLDALAGPVGIEAAAIVGLGLFALPGALLVTMRRVSLPFIVLSLLLVRVTAQFLPALPVIGAGAVLAMVALGIAVQRAGDPVTATSGLLAGGALDLVIRSVTWTWDPIWVGLWGLPVTVLPGVALWLSLSVQTPERGAVLLGRIWAVGAYLALWTTTIGNPAFVASQSGIGLQVCLVVLLAGLAAAVELARQMRLEGGSGRIPEPDRWYAGILAALTLILFVGLAWWLNAVIVLGAVVAVQLFAAICLARALAPVGGTHFDLPDSARGHGQLGLASVAGGDGPRSAPGSQGGLSSVFATRGSDRSGSASAARGGVTGSWSRSSGEFALLHAAAAIGGPSRERAGGGWNWAYGLVWVLPVLLFQVHYDKPLPFDNRLVLVAVAALLGLAAIGRRPPSLASMFGATLDPLASSPRVGASSDSSTSLLHPQPHRAAMGPFAAPIQGRGGSAPVLGVASDPLAAPLRRLLPAGAGAWASRVVLAALLVPGLMLLLPVEKGPAPGEAGSIRLLSWNVKYGRDDVRGVVDPAQIAAVIRAQAPDRGEACCLAGNYVVVLQEVSRGWAIGGGLDLAEYLSRELGMASYWGPAADHQFGNLLLTNIPVTQVSVGRLPFGQGPMQRSYLKFRLQPGNSVEVDVMTTHLTHRKQNTPTRLTQIDTLLRERPAVLAGDLNFWPTWDESRAFSRAGYVSAQDYTGHGSEWTSPSTEPANRVDWIYGTPNVAFSNFAVLDTVTASDHFPIVVTFRP